MKLIYFYLIVIFLYGGFSINTTGQVTPPSCVITAPHSNSYFQKGSDIIIKIYSSTAGGSYQGFPVIKIELYNNGVFIGEANTQVSNTYTFVWQGVAVGTHLITAKAYDSNGNNSLSAGVIINVGNVAVTKTGMSACKGKYVGNIIAGTIRNDYTTYWNAVTSENAAKWGSIEHSRNIMNWTLADLAYNHARTNNIPYRYHVLAWGSQYPSWITSLQPNDFKAEMEQLMSLVSQRYPFIDQVEVLNEAMYLNTWNGQEHAAGTPYFRAGLGGPGVTGYDWAIWLFEKARHYFPNSKLVLNDFELENNQNGIRELLNMIKVLRDRNLIDGFGTQAHTFNVDNTSANAIQSALNLMATSGIPIYVTELDLKGTANPATEASQLASYQKAFPVYWNHPAVAGISLWGYVQGTMWQADAYLLSSSGTERTALSWLKSYLSERPDVGYPCCPVPPTNVIGVRSGINDNLISLFPNPATNGRVNLQIKQPVTSNISVSIYNQYGQLLLHYNNPPTDSFDINLNGFANGLYLIHLSCDVWYSVKKIVIMQ